MPEPKSIVVGEAQQELMEWQGQWVVQLKTAWLTILDDLMLLCCLFVRLFVNKFASDEC
jgi:hypothetical protein